MTDKAAYVVPPLVAEWNANFNPPEPFAKLFDTPHGQFLAYIDYEDEDAYLIRTVGAPVRGAIPKANLGYDSEDARQRAFDKIDQALAEGSAQSLFEVADSLAPLDDQ